MEDNKYTEFDKQLSARDEIHVLVPTIDATLDVSASGHDADDHSEALQLQNGQLTVLMTDQAFGDNTSDLGPVHERRSRKSPLKNTTLCSSTSKATLSPGSMDVGVPGHGILASSTSKPTSNPDSIRIKSHRSMLSEVLLGKSVGKKAAPSSSKPKTASSPCSIYPKTWCYTCRIRHKVLCVS
jgi:hypothetical protein